MLEFLAKLLLFGFDMIRNNGFAFKNLRIIVSKMRLFFNNAKTKWRFAFLALIDLVSNL